MTSPQYQPAPPAQSGAGETPLWAPLYGASLPQAFQRFFKKYADFSGRASRSEYWWWYLVSFLVTVALELLSLALGGRGTFVNASTYLESGLDPELLRYFYAGNLGPGVPDRDGPAALHLARTVTRRAERLAVALAQDPAEHVNREAVKYLNRASDFLFVAARAVNDNGRADVLWVPGENR